MASVVQQAIALHQQGQLEQAAALYEAALTQNPREADALLNLSTLRAQQGNLSAAEALLASLITAHPKLAYGYYAYGNLLLATQRAEEARAQFVKAIPLAPKMAECHHNYAIALGQLGREDEAIAAYQKTLGINPKFFQSHLNLAILYQQRGALNDALTHANRALTLQPQSAEALATRAMALNSLCRFEEALADSDAAIALAAHFALAHNHRGNALLGLHRHREAIAAYEQAHRLSPQDIDPRWNLATAHLALGEFAAGWRYYEHRWETQALKPLAPQFRVPLWLGDASIAGKTLCIYHEQGFGDSLQMARYIPLLLAAGAQLVVGIPAALETLFRASFTQPGVTFVIDGGALPPFDYHCPFMSLPLAFKTMLETIPTNIPYLQVPKETITRWREHLGAAPKLRVGLVTSGAAHHVNDRNRSVPMALLAPLLTLPCEFHSLQKEFRAEDAAHLSTVITHAEKIIDFADTAALIHAMDLIITVDTSVAHLAGALGKPVWVLLPRHGVDFRWLLEREDSPWYPGVRLFRHHRGDEDWSHVLARVGDALTQRIATP